LQQKAVAAAGAPAKSEVAAYYTSQRGQFALPARRDLLVVVTKTRAKALAARQALRAGASFAAIVRRSSIDLTTNRRDGRLAGVVAGTHGPAFDNAVFSAREGQLVGPVQTPRGYYVLKVTKIAAAQRPTLAGAAPAIRRLLTGQRRQKALAALSARFAKDWRGRTQCARGYIVAGCANAPKPTKAGR
jgi:parvulin-like peptidyl-prolyl isomerase